MGLFSWIATTGRKSEAASLIQQFFELSKQHGMFRGDPAGTANRITGLACNRVPDLSEKRKGRVLAASVLAIAVLEDDMPIEARDHFAMALAGMLKAAHAERHLHSYEDQQMLAVAQQVYAKFREVVPSPPAQAPSQRAPMPTKPEASSEAKPETARDRERAMDELIKRMRA